MTSRRLSIVSLLLASVLASPLAACSRKVPPQATSLDAERANVSLAELQEGRTLTIRKCGNCHQPPMPYEHTAADWPRMLDEMAQRSNLDAKQRHYIEQYLVVMAEATRRRPRRSSPRSPDGGRDIARDVRTNCTYNRCMSPKNDERVELRLSAIDLRYWREAAEAAGISLSDWIRRACHEALPEDAQMMIYRHELAEKRGATLHEVVDDGTGRFDGGRFLVVKSRKHDKAK
ncbi:MAG TPA: hypothetical protein VFQ53_12855 [Kofleriaceae bacterium]|nr:hypothetical protein [Kofleriaceae bacterium]